MATLSLTITNNSTHNDDDVYIGFVAGQISAGTPQPMEITYGDNQSIVPVNVSQATPVSYPFAGNWYRLDALAGGLTVKTFSGRIYVAYGQPWAPQGAFYEPAQSVTDPNFFLRYDKIEMTFTGSASDVANLTSIDYWSIPMSLSTSLDDKLVQAVLGLKGSATADTIYNALYALTSDCKPAKGTTPSNGDKLPALVPGFFSQENPSSPAPGTAFARIIGPSSYPTQFPTAGVPVMPYNNLRDYLQSLFDHFGPRAPSPIPSLGKGIFAHIKGHFGGVGPNVPVSGPESPQAYDLQASIDKDLNVTLTGTCGDQATTMVYAVDDLLNPTGIYGGNAPVLIYENNSTTPTTAAPTPAGNNVYGWVNGDLMSGLNIGAVGSLAPSSGIGSAVVGGMNSQGWFSLKEGTFFAGMQSNGHYNQWAATLAPLSNAYNFAYSDRFAPVFASLNPATVDTLTLTLEADITAQ